MELGVAATDAVTVPVSVPVADDWSPVARGMWPVAANPPSIDGSHRDPMDRSPEVTR